MATRTLLGIGALTSWGMGTLAAVPGISDYDDLQRMILHAAVILSIIWFISRVADRNCAETRHVCEHVKARNIIARTAHGDPGEWRDGPR